MSYFSGEVPAELPRLSQVEEMLISQICFYQVIMRRGVNGGVSVDGGM
ncbi:19483_t:CDS:2 [Gigaspora rosea]|nr:19483_t:CDS:2 [Gigaspora rosea]